MPRPIVLRARAIAPAVPFPTGVHFHSPPSHLCREKDFPKTRAALLLIGYYSSWWRNGKDCYVSVDRLCRELSLSRRTVQKTNRLLFKLGWLYVARSLPPTVSSTGYTQDTNTYIPGHRFRNGRDGTFSKNPDPRFTENH